VLLAIDTSTAFASVALYDGTVLFEATWLAGREHSRQLLPRVADGLVAIGRTVSDIAAVGVAIGPGSFNGLRVGLSTAKAMCLANVLPIVGIETLQSTAVQYRLTGRPIRPLFAAGRDEVATGLYKARTDRFLALEEPRQTTIAEAIQASPPETLFCGEIKPAWRAAILADARFADPTCHVAGGAENTRRAGFLAELAWNRLMEGDVDDLATIQPLYLRRPSITMRAAVVGSVAR
jgi:tRNA threonylcarbamoyladenosine biosynthesis protein TsaB